MSTRTPPRRRASSRPNHRVKAGADLIIKRRRQGQPPEVVGIAVKAQHRLSKRYWHLVQRKHHNVAVIAVARELCGFVWALMRAVPGQTSATVAASIEHELVEMKG